MTTVRRGLLVFAVACSCLWATRGPVFADVRREALVVWVQGATMEDLLGVTELRGLAAAGGAGLLSSRLPFEDAVSYLVANDEPGNAGIDIAMEGLFLDDEGSVQAPDGGASLPALTRIADRLRSDLEGSGSDRVLVVFASSSPPTASVDAGDALSGVIVASGDPGDLAAALRSDAAPSSSIRSLTSDSTRREGVVTSRDVPESVADFLGTAGPDGDPSGAVIRVAPGPPPFELHERYLAQRRMYVPIGIAAGLYVTLAGSFGALLLAIRSRVPARLGHVAGWVAISAPALAVGLLAAGHLPTLSYATVVPFVIAVTLVGTSAFAPLRRFGTLVPPVAIGAAVLAFFAAEAALGWTAALTPFHGGSELDGGRFYGLPNAFIGLLIGASLYVAHRLRPVAGLALITAVGLFAGWPGAGANLGGAISLFAAAGLWLAQRRFGRIGWKGLAATALVVVLGTTFVLLAHRFWTSAPTHVTRFEEATGGISGIWRTFTDRLLVGWRLIERNPFALVPVLGLFAVLIVLLRPPEPLRAPLEDHQGWRDALLVTILAGIVAYVVNDSGAAAVGLAFALGLSGLLYVSLMEGTWKMGAT